ncbi:MAG: hypothetical protein K2K73_00680, partial [Ureaplasma sp.]|nr:hypothetical protein [Ureaplasma sp.]
YKSWWVSNLVLILYMMLLIGLCALFSLVIKSNYTGFWCGFGISLSSLITFGILCLYLRYRLKISFRFHNYFWTTIHRVFKNSYKQLLIIVTIQIFKAIALICLGLIVTDSIEGIVPISYQLSRVIWYNLLYLLPFLGYGIADAVLFYGFYEQNIFYSNQFNKLVVIIFSFVFVFELIFSIGVYYLIPKLAEIYLANNDPSISLEQFNIDDINIVTLLESLLKKESFIQKLEGIDQKTVFDAIKKFNNELPDWMVNTVAKMLVDYKDKFIDPNTRTEAINTFAKELVKNLPHLNSELKRFFAFYLQNAKVDSVNKMFSVNSCNTYYFMVTWTTLYSCGLIFNNAKIILRKNTVTWWQALLISLVQAIVIIAIVAFGITQQYSIALPMYDAWTMPLCVASIIIFGYYLITYLIQYKKSLLFSPLNKYRRHIYRW